MKQEKQASTTSTALESQSYQPLEEHLHNFPHQRVYNKRGQGLLFVVSFLGKSQKRTEPAYLEGSDSHFDRTEILNEGGAPLFLITRSGFGKKSKAARLPEIPRRTPPSPCPRSAARSGSAAKAGRCPPEGHSPMCTCNVAIDVGRRWLFGLVGKEGAQEGESCRIFRGIFLFRMSRVSHKNHFGLLALCRRLATSLIGEEEQSQQMVSGYPPKKI